jgi:carbon-monoxide dehydrogenase medium subunit
VTPARFDYHRPDRIDQAVALLAKHGDEARLLAGGHSLLPMMKLRLATPGHLIDLQGLKELKGISEDKGEIRIGAMTTQFELLASALVAEACPILLEAAAQIADPQVRYLGTVGGNCANGDPGNDLPAVMMALDAAYVLRGPGGTRTVKADGFYRGPYATAMAANEILTEIRVPRPARGHGYSYPKMKRKVGDYAVAGAAVVLGVKGGTCSSAAVALTNVGPTPLKVAAAAKALVGSRVDAGAIAKAEAAAREIADPASDMRGPPEFRRHVAGIMTRRAIEAALRRAQAG